MTKHKPLIFTGVRTGIPIPARKKTGTKPYDMDEAHVVEAVEGIRCGKYKNANNAAHIIATDIANEINYDATKRRLRNKISAILKVT